MIYREKMKKKIQNEQIIVQIVPGFIKDGSIRKSLMTLPLLLSFCYQREQISLLPESTNFCSVGGSLNERSII